MALKYTNHNVFPNFIELVLNLRGTRNPYTKCKVRDVKKGDIALKRVLSKLDQINICTSRPTSLDLLRKSKSE